MNYYFLQEDLNIDTIYLDSYQSNIEGVRLELNEGKSLKNKISYIKNRGTF